MDLQRGISQIAFIFLIFVVISSGYISNIVSCQMQNMLKYNLYARHVIGIIMVFVFIMLEGGWDFDKQRENQSSNNWSTGNTVTTLIYSLLIYILFLLSSKSRLIPNLIFFTLVFIIYFTNTYRAYIYEREEIDSKFNDEIMIFEYILLLLAFIVLVYGFYDYVIYQKRLRGPTFNWNKFMLGVTRCEHI
jgi:hypothetical protein